MNMQTFDGAIFVVLGGSPLDIKNKITNSRTRWMNGVMSISHPEASIMLCDP
jgi:hypothetical protein